jgi:hypothetical protein
MCYVKVRVRKYRKTGQSHWKGLGKRGGGRVESQPIEARNRKMLFAGTLERKVRSESMFL